MESITIKLSSEIASKYQQISDQDRENIQKQIENIINLELEKIKKYLLVLNPFREVNILQPDEFLSTLCLKSAINSDYIN